MDIILVSALFKPHMGGVERYTENLAATLSSMGHNITIITSKISSTNEYERDPKGYTIVRLASVCLMHERFPVLLPVLSRNLTNRLPENPDAIVINTRYYPITLFGLKLARKLDAKAFVIDHSSSHISTGNKIVNLAFELYEHAISSCAKKYKPSFCAVSTESAQWLAHFGITSTAILHNAIDINNFLSQKSNRDFRLECSLSQQAFLVVFTGRLLVEKGIWECLNAARLLQQENVHFLIAGTGDQENALKKEAPCNFHLLGRLNYPDISALLLQADAFCFPSQYPEGLPTSLLEAGAAGLPIVTYQNGGTSELIPNSSYGIVLTNTSKISLVDALLTLKEDQNMRKLMGKNIKKHVRDSFSWDTTASNLINIIRQA